MAETLVARMTVEEAASQLLHASPAISRLGVPKYNWWKEALHGAGRDQSGIIGLIGSKITGAINI